MAALAAPIEPAGPLVLHLPEGLELTDDQFFEFCRVNDPWRMERTAEGDILIMAPVGGSFSSRNADLTAQLQSWSRRDGRGVVFDSSAGFSLPNGAIRAPDASWVAKPRLHALPPERKDKFLPLCPDFVVELRSAADRLSTLKDKMQEYIDNGAQLGWLIDPLRRDVYVYRPGAPLERLQNPATVSGEPVLPGFVLELREIWDPGF